MCSSCSGNQNFVDKKKDELNKKNVEVKNQYKVIANLVNGKTFLFNKESKENGELYGSIKPKEITSLIKEKVNAEVSPSQIILKDDLNNYFFLQFLERWPSGLRRTLGKRV